MKQLMKSFAGPDPTLTDVRRLGTMDIAGNLNQMFRSDATLSQTTLDGDDWESLSRVSKFYARLAWELAKNFAREHSFHLKLDPEDLWSEAYLVLAEKLSKLSGEDTVTDFTAQLSTAIWNHYVDFLRRETGIRKRKGQITGKKTYTGAVDSVFERSGKSKPPSGPEMEELIDSVQDMRAWIPALAPEDLEIMTPLLSKLDLRCDYDFTGRELAVRFKSVDACRGQRNGNAKGRAAELGDIFHNRWDPTYEPNPVKLTESDDVASNIEGRNGTRPGMSNVSVDGNDRKRNPCFAKPQSKPCTRITATSDRQRSSRPVKLAGRDSQYVNGHKTFSPLRCGGAKHE